MKLVKRLLVLVAAMTMVLSLTACGEKFPQTYTYSEPRGEGEQVRQIVLEEDGTYVYTFYATESNGSGNKVMEVEMTGEYTLDGETLTLDTAEGKGYYMAGASKTEFTFDKENPGMYANAGAAGAFVFTLNGETFDPVVE